MLGEVLARIRARRLRKIQRQTNHDAAEITRRFRELQDTGDPSLIDSQPRGKAHAALASAEDADRENNGFWI